MVLAVMFVNASQFGCYFKVACSATESLAVSDSFINHFLFPYEKVGGPWYNSQINSTVYPLGFKLTLFFLFMTMCVLHHVGYYLITNKMTNYLSNTLKWDGSCVRRKTPPKKVNVDAKATHNKGLENENTAEYVIGRSLD
jgi:hypothetical protein